LDAIPYGGLSGVILAAKVKIFIKNLTLEGIPDKSEQNVKEDVI